MLLEWLCPTAPPMQSFLPHTDIPYLFPLKPLPKCNPSFHTQPFLFISAQTSHQIPPSFTAAQARRCRRELVVLGLQHQPAVISQESWSAAGTAALMWLEAWADMRREVTTLGWQWCHCGWSPHGEGKRGGHGKKSMALPEGPDGWKAGEWCCWRMLMCPAVNETSSACSHSSFKTLLGVPARPWRTFTPQPHTCSSTGSLRGKHQVKGNRIPLVNPSVTRSYMEPRCRGGCKSQGLHETSSMWGGKREREKGGREQFAHIEIPVTARALRGFVWCPLANP